MSAQSRCRHRHAGLADAYDRQTGRFPSANSRLPVVVA
ncbi:MAG: hypothetical protein KBS99_08740 [Prevotellaceae bacterium]|nr:hypothetical protein [Candidatus Colivivens caballi]